MILVIIKLENQFMMSRDNQLSKVIKKNIFSPNAPLAPER